MLISDRVVSISSRSVKSLSEFATLNSQNQMGRFGFDISLPVYYNPTQVKRSKFILVLHLSDIYSLVHKTKSRFQARRSRFPAGRKININAFSALKTDFNKKKVI